MVKGRMKRMRSPARECSLVHAALYGTHVTDRSCTANLRRSEDDRFVDRFSTDTPPTTTCRPSEEGTLGRGGGRRSVIVPRWTASTTRDQAMTSRSTSSSSRCFMAAFLASASRRLRRDASRLADSDMPSFSGSLGIDSAISRCSFAMPPASRNTLTGAVFTSTSTAKGFLAGSDVQTAKVALTSASDFSECASSMYRLARAGAVPPDGAAPDGVSVSRNRPSSLGVRPPAAADSSSSP
mmetsp:Transcript_3938/g.12772  ORF Transcript_3938/g.12772 Transcript_3938/m.12772 type:complete len:239 (+) Transcript_3938:1949-2665(+)